ncbi:hypothetical protein CMUS01_01730 [Colletotrichum musicola]|uniref:Uncharacterized protein n=1 Tax=Colletotrichum musicola TaxID=2175873 RepID=A0A8H6NWE2_9PEZI|nr:hypothetical protein CMUS01_01730 [Colletotrichum musicola]
MQVAPPNMYLALNCNCGAVSWRDARLKEGGKVQKERKERRREGQNEKKKKAKPTQLHHTMAGSTYPDVWAGWTGWTGWTTPTGKRWDRAGGRRAVKEGRKEKKNMDGMSLAQKNCSAQTLTPPTRGLETATPWLRLVQQRTKAPRTVQGPPPPLPPSGRGPTER